MLSENGDATLIGVFAGRGHFGEVTFELSKSLVMRRNSHNTIWRKGKVFQAKEATLAKTEIG